MSPAAITLAFVAGYLALSVVVALLLGRLIALQYSQVPPRTTEVPGARITFARDVSPEQAEAFRQAFIRASEDTR